MFRTTVLALLACAAVATGCNRERPDATVNAAVLAQLDKEPALAAATVQSRTEQGHVYLTGRVTTPDQRKRAEDIADDVKGVKGVTNDIQIDVASPPPTAAPAPPTAPPGGAMTPPTTPTPESGTPETNEAPNPTPMPDDRAEEPQQ
jgi:BON domain-containing protein